MLVITTVIKLQQSVQLEALPNQSSAVSTSIGIIHIFHALTFAVARGNCLNPRPPVVQSGSKRHDKC